MALTKAKLIADNAVKAVHIDETDTGITLAQLNVTGDITASSGTITASAFVGDGSGITGVSSDYTVSEISTNTTAVANNLYVLTASLTLTLPASPQVGDKVAVSNMSGTTTPVIARNGSLILGLAEDLTINVENISVEFIYSGATEGWVVFTDSILGYASVDTIDGSGTTNYISKWSASDTLTDSGITDDGSTITLSTASTERMRITSAGEVFIGTTSVEGSSQFVVVDNNNGASIRTNAANANEWAAAVFSRSGNNGKVLEFRQNITGPAVGSIDVSATGASIYLGGNAAANALDDYEEGTWTPVLTGSSTNPTYTTSGIQGFYTKIGNIVNFHFGFQLNSYTAGSGSIRVSLPFTATNIYSLSNVMLRHANKNDTAYQIVFETTGNQAFGVFIEQFDDANSAQMETSDFKSTSQLYASGFFYVS